MLRYIKAFLFNVYDHKWASAPTDHTGLTMFTVANDLHIGSDYQDNPNALQELNQLKVLDIYMILLGDIFDLACCKKSKVPELEYLMNKYSTIFGVDYIMGNHERNGLEDRVISYRTKAGKYYAFTHGDLISDYDKWSKYRLKPRGASFFQLLFTKFLDDLDHLKAKRPLPEGFIERAYEYCVKNKVDGVVCGHFHPEEERRYFYQGKTIIILPAHKINRVWL